MVLAAAPGTHPLTPVCGDQHLSLLVLNFYYCAFTLDSLVSSLIAGIITVVIGLAIAARVRSDVPGKLQMLLEFFLGYARGLIRESVAEDAGFILPLAATLGMYIAIANWIDFFPLGFSPWIEPANSDLNQTLAMAVLVFLLVQGYSIKVLGLRGYLRRFTKPFELNWAVRVAFIPLNIIEEIVKPVTLSLRLFGNLFAGLLMVYLLTLLPFFVAWFPVAAWKFFDVFFVGTIQAFIFMLLTIIYFGMAREGLEEELHAHAASAGHDMEDAATAAITQ
ncbi:MAG TPA: FoF1 ATP synthase subunit a [Isosphaeraceae bacterium]|nr:FoF1 ATP synthase subunit a [Candidatus Dormibacteraeota bacterium]HZW33933.1 FoF1 ATP synthase subunit a [Isosphaeraceae bacterium]